MRRRWFRMTAPIDFSSALGLAISTNIISTVWPHSYFFKAEPKRRLCDPYWTPFIVNCFLLFASAFLSINATFVHQPASMSSWLSMRHVIYAELVFESMRYAVYFSSYDIRKRAAGYTLQEKWMKFWQCWFFQILRADTHPCIRQAMHWHLLKWLWHSWRQCFCHRDDHDSLSM